MVAHDPRNPPQLERLESEVLSHGDCAEPEFRQPILARYVNMGRLMPFIAVEE